MRKLFGIVILCAVAASAMAVPARRDGMIRTDANGTEKMVFLHGNETFHYMTDADGNWLDEKTLLPMSAEAKAARENHGMARVAARRAKQETGVSRLLAPRGVIILVSFKEKAFSQISSSCSSVSQNPDPKPPRA